MPHTAYNRNAAADNVRAYYKVMFRNSLVVNNFQHNTLLHKGILGLHVMGLHVCLRIRVYINNGVRQLTEHRQMRGHFKKQEIKGITVNPDAVLFFKLHWMIINIEIV